MMMMDFSVLDSLQRTGPNAYFFFWRGKGGGVVWFCSRGFLGSCLTLII